MQIKSLKVQTAMADFDIEQTPSGKQRAHSIKFWEKDGTERFIPLGIKCGVNNKNMGATDTKGIQAVDRYMRVIGHPIPFKWYKIFEYDKQEVKL
jgi:hypothetical protein